MNLTVTAARHGRTWYGRRTYAVTIADATGRITFHGYHRRDAAALAASIGPLVGQHRPPRRPAAGRCPRQHPGPGVGAA
jgi:hypothetical protein